MTAIYEVRARRLDDLVGRAARGERQAFTAIVDDYQEAMLRVAFVVCGDADLARDATQTAWIKIWRGLPRLREPEKLRAWVIAVAANEARQAARSRRRRIVHEVRIAEESETVAAWDHAQAEDAIDSADLARALRQLSPDDRALIAMRYLAGLSSDEIGALTFRSPSGVRARLTRLLRRLRKELDDA